MNSFICEDKNLFSAIQKAFKIAQYPSTFTIKILEKGEKFFLWWKNKPAVILFSYNLESKQAENKQKDYSKKNIYGKNFDMRESGKESSSKNPHYRKKSIDSTTEKQIKKNDFYVSASNKQEKLTKSTNNKNIINNDTYVSSKKEILKNNYDEVKNRTPLKMVKNNVADLGALLKNKDEDIISSLGQKQLKDHQNSYKDNTCNTKEVSDTSDNQNLLSSIQKVLESLNKFSNISKDPISLEKVNSTLVVNISNIYENEKVSKETLFISIKTFLYEYIKEKETNQIKTIKRIIIKSL